MKNSSSKTVPTATNSGQGLPVDLAAIGKYGLGLGIQLSLIFGFFSAADTALTKLFSVDISAIPVWVNAIVFYFLNLNTSFFSPLPSRRDTNQTGWEYQKRNRPFWTPPGWVFAVMWPLFVFGTRAVTAAIIVQSVGKYANAAIMALMLHLAVANLWNTM
jgi:hypothetical protein